MYEGKQSAVARKLMVPVIPPLENQTSLGLGLDHFGVSGYWSLSAISPSSLREEAEAPLALSGFFVFFNQMKIVLRVLCKVPLRKTRLCFSSQSRTRKNITSLLPAAFLFLFSCSFFSLSLARCRLQFARPASRLCKLHPVRGNLEKPRRQRDMVDIPVQRCDGHAPD